MTERLDSSSPVPLYHQIAEALRYRIATGSVAPGDLLPALREAATLWGVNLHTVRRAYGELARDGLVEIRPPLGTRVLRAPEPPVRAGGERAFLARVVHEARMHHGLTVERLVAALQGFDFAAAESATVHVVECSETQAADLAAQLAARWRVEARPFSLDQPGELPAGPLVATYFHYNDVRSRSPARLASVRFLAIRPDPGLLQRLAPEARRGDPVEVTLCERAPGMAANIAADLTAILPPSAFRLVTRLAEEPGSLLRDDTPGPVLFSPRVWGELTPAERAHPRAVEVRYVFDPADLEAVGARFGWAPR